MLADTPKIALPYRGGNASLREQEAAGLGSSANKRGQHSDSDEEEDADALDFDHNDQVDDVNSRKRQQQVELRSPAQKGSDHGLRNRDGPKGSAKRAADAGYAGQDGSPVSG